MPLGNVNTAVFGVSGCSRLYRAWRVGVPSPRTKVLIKLNGHVSGSAGNGGQREV